MDDIIYDLLNIFDQDIYLINNQYQILYTNHHRGLTPDFLNIKEEKNAGIPCYKLIFNFDSPCQYCGFSFDQGDIQIKSIKKNIRIKNLIGNGSIDKDLMLIQTVLGRDEFIYVDMIQVSQDESIYDASDQLTTLGAHVQTVAHELSNPITGLNLTRQQIVKILDSADVVNSGDLRPLVDLLLKDIRRAAGVLSEIRNYSRPVTKSYRLIDLRSILVSAIDNVTRVYQSDNVKVSFKWNVLEHCAIPGNSAKLEQCFINIIKNSFEMFTLRKNPDLPEVTIRVDPTDIPGMIKIQIIDNAGGISNEALTKVFKPYFTTKERFRGLGLGLYIAGKILKEHRSTISMESKGEKTIVTIYMKQQDGTK